MSKRTLSSLQELKKSGTPISMLTCYDAATARTLDHCGIDAVLVGDSVGTNVLGYDSEREVTLSDIIHHTKAVSRGLSQAVLLSDLPYNSYNTVPQTLTSAEALIDAGADAVKFEGFRPELVEALAKEKISAVCHLGLLPQWHTSKKLQANHLDTAKELIKQAIALEASGASLLVLELIPEELAQLVSQTLDIPVIGIAAGRYCDGQVQIIQDIYGQTDRVYKHVRRYDSLKDTQHEIITQYISDIKSSTLLNQDHSFHMDPATLSAVRQAVSISKSSS